VGNISPLWQAFADEPGPAILGTPFLGSLCGCEVGSTGDWATQ